MKILHCIEKEVWEKMKGKKYPGKDLLDAPVKWEDLEGCGRTYPHIYGPIKADAVRQVLPYLRKEDGTWQKNPELAETADR